MTKLSENYFYTIMYEKCKGCLQNQETLPLEDLAVLSTEATHNRLTSVSSERSWHWCGGGEELSYALFFWCAYYVLSGLPSPLPQSKLQEET